MKNFSSVELFDKNAKKIKMAGNKGHKQEVHEFINSIKSGNNTPISFDSLNDTSLITFKILESIEKGTSINL